MKIALVEETEIKKRGLGRQHFKSETEYQEYLAKRKGFNSSAEYQKHSIKERGFNSYAEYEDDLAKRKGFDSRAEYRKHLIKEREFETWTEYNNHIAKEKGFDNHAEYSREYTYDILGRLPMSENKDCPQYLGVHIAENRVAKEVLSKVYKNVEKMPNNKHGYDYLYDNEKIDVKSSSLHSYNKYDEWDFSINNNNIADQFLLITFSKIFGDEKLKTMKIWLIPKDAIIRGKEFWDRTGIQINNTLEGLREFEKYELKEGLEHLLECCDQQ